MKILDEIEARANAATKGPWEQEIVSTGDAPFNNVVFQRSLADQRVIKDIWDLDEQTAIFIAHSRTDVPRFCKALRFAIDNQELERDWFLAEIERILKGGGE